MADYLLLMHGDVIRTEADAWPAYLDGLAKRGVLRGGSAIGEGACFRAEGPVPPVSAQLTGFVRIAVPDLEAAKACLAGNPVYEAGGTVEIRHLPQEE